ncbi:MAG: hypothetical protein M3527_10505, partial [Actinomycetota bacterium]|nr:hypothetical protein [Actinomycetota bacterium]
AEPRSDDERAGRQLMAQGSPAGAIVAFRQWAYQCPDDPIAHLQLGVALDQEGEGTKARRAYRASLAALDRCDLDELAAGLEGYGVAELRTLLVARSGAAIAAPTADVVVVR